MGNPHLKDFPNNSIQGAAGKFADLFSNYLESPWQFLGMGYLTCLGNLIADKVSLESEISPQPRLYTIAVGESADDRKSEGMIRQPINFFRQALSGHPFSFNVCMGVGSAEGLAKEFSGRGPNLLLAFDELKAFVSKAQIDGSILTPCVNTLFDSNTFHSSTKKKTISLDHAYLSLLGACTAETYRRMWTPTFLDIGFINRLFPITGKGRRRFAIPKIIPESEKRPLENQVLSILKFVDSLPKQNGLYPMPIDSDAYELFTSWYLRQEQSLFAKRLDTYGHRLLILLAVNEGRDRITSDITQKVIELLDWQLEVRRELDPIDCETLIAKIEGVIKRTLASGPLSKRDLERKCNASRYGIYYWKRVLKDLIMDDRVRWNEEKDAYELC
ncbi:MAG: DUF3987 domain-containing protein [Thermodesulfobacteriota bacterium]|jgi:hypothetical protein